MNDFRNAEHYPDPTPHEALKNIESEGNIRRGDIYEIHKHVNRDTGEKSDEKMLCVIVSNDDINANTGFVEYVMISDIQFDGYETTVPIKRSGIKGCVVCSKVNTCGKNKIGDLVSVCFDDELKAIDAALMASLGISTAEEVAPPVTRPTPPPQREVVFIDDPEKDAKIIRLETEKALYESLYKELLQKMLAK